MFKPLLPRGKKRNILPPFACDILNSGALQRDYAISNIHLSGLGWGFVCVCVWVCLFHLRISVMLSVPGGIAAGFSLQCLLYAWTVLLGRARALTSVKDSPLKLGVRGGLAHRHTHTHTSIRSVCFASGFTLRCEFPWGSAIGFVCFQSWSAVIRTTQTLYFASATI